MSHLSAITSALHTTPLKNKRVFVRVDLNVPTANGIVLDDYRLQSTRPTLDALINQGAKVILATHIGRPKGNDPLLSTAILTDWFKTHGYAITQEPDLTKALESSHRDNSTILLLENMRFFPGEKTGDLLFAHQLAALADYYVNDAFALLHRNDTSITLVPSLFTPENKTVGFLVEKELCMLDRLLNNPPKPFVLILGGGKIGDKIPLMYALIDKVDTILLCPAVVFTFLKVLNKPVGKSLIDDDAENTCITFLKDAQARSITLLFPTDYQIADNDFNGPLSLTQADQFPPNAVGISIGPDTIARFTQEIHNAGTIFANGLMGSVRRPATLAGAQALFKAMAQSHGLSIVGGGDSVAATRLCNVDTDLDFISTGGGATLAYLAGQDLPGLSHIIKK